jgi:hypothetical protein
MPRPQPTNAAPGGSPKVEVLRARAEQRQPLFHPCDQAECRAGETAHQGNGGRHAHQEQQQPEPSRHVFREPASHDME